MYFANFTNDHIEEGESIIALSPQPMSNKSYGSEVTVLCLWGTTASYWENA